MAAPKKFQNTYRQATYEGTTYKIGDLIRSLGSPGYIQKVCATGAWVLFKTYEAEVDWQDIEPYARAKKQISAERASTPEVHSTPARERKSIATDESGCLELLAKERAASAREAARASELEAEVAALKSRYGALELECKEERGNDVSISPRGNLVTSTIPTGRYVIAGGSTKAVERSLAKKETVIVVAPRDLAYDDIDFETDVKVVYPVSRSIKWIANDAYNRGYRDAEYQIYQIVPASSAIFTYSIDKNQTIENIRSATKPKTDPVTIRESNNCRVEIVRLAARDTVRIIFDSLPSREATAILKKQGFRYYKEKGTDVQYWGTFLTTEKLRFAKEFCGDSTQVPELPAPSDERTASCENDESPEILTPESSENPMHATAPDSSIDHDSLPREEDLDKAESALNNIESLLREALRK